MTCWRLFVKLARRFKSSSFIHHPVHWISLSVSHNQQLLTPFLPCVFPTCCFKCFMMTPAILRTFHRCRYFIQVPPQHWSELAEKWEFTIVRHGPTSAGPDCVHINQSCFALLSSYHSTISKQLPKKQVNFSSHSWYVVVCHLNGNHQVNNQCACIHWNHGSFSSLIEKCFGDEVIFWTIMYLVKEKRGLKLFLRKGK